MQKKYLCVVKGQGVEFKLQKANQKQIQEYQKDFASDFEGSYDEMFESIESGGLLDGIYANPLESFIEVYKGSSGVGEPLFTINIKEISDAVNGEVINRGFVGLSESSRGTVGAFLINLPEDELFDPRSLGVHISTVKTSNNGDINFATGFSYRGYEGSSDEFDYQEGVDASLMLDVFNMNLDTKRQNFVFNFDSKSKLLTQEQLDNAAQKYYEQWQSKEKILFEQFKKDVITLEAVSKAASYFSIGRNFPGNDISRWQHVINALNLIQPVDMNPFTKVHEHLVKTMGVKNVPSATSKFIFLRKRNHSLPIYDSVVKKSLGLRANCSYTEFKEAFNVIFVDYQKELKIACNKLDIEIAKQAWFHMRVLDIALWQLGTQK